MLNKDLILHRPSNTSEILDLPEELKGTVVNIANTKILYTDYWAISLINNGKVLTYNASSDEDGIVDVIHQTDSANVSAENQDIVWKIASTYACFPGTAERISMFLQAYKISNPIFVYDRNSMFDFVQTYQSNYSLNLLGDHMLGIYGLMIDSLPSNTGNVVYTTELTPELYTRLLQFWDITYEEYALNGLQVEVAGQEGGEISFINYNGYYLVGDTVEIALIPDSGYVSPIQLNVIYQIGEEQQGYYYPVVNNRCTFTIPTNLKQGTGRRILIPTVKFGRG
jgi:hypothetical protein